jgi:hypothetical protein
MAQKVFKESYINLLAKQLRQGDSKTVKLLRKSPLVYTDENVVDLVDYPDLSELPLVDKSSDKDFQYQNAILLYEKLRINPYQASNPALWTFLALVTFRDYMSKLRSDISADNDLNEGRYLLSHYFCAGSAVKDLLLNDISLLWWGAHLTVQKDTEAPYKLTKEVFSMLDYTRHLLPGSQGRNPAFRHAVLEFVVENPELFKAKREGGTGSREGKVRFILRRLNTFAGYQLFPFFNKEEIKELMAEMREEILQYKDAD